MSSTDMNPFDETGTENLDMEDPPADTALARQDLADSGSDHPAEAQQQQHGDGDGGHGRWQHHRRW